VPIQDGIKVGISTELWMTNLLNKIHNIKKIKNFHDVGANLGQTLIKIKTIDSSINYHAFEPNYLCSNYLSKLIKINNWINTHIYPIGIFNEDSLKYLEGKSDYDKSSSIMPDCAETKKIVRKITSFYTYESIKKLIGDENVDIIKIDTEGSELEVIQSYKSLLTKDSPLVLIEILKLQKDNQKKIKRDQDLSLFIHSLNYNIYRIYKDSNNKLVNLKKEKSLGTYDDNQYADHLLIHDSKINIYNKLLA
jgi:FkbM family methyltransferase